MHKVMYCLGGIGIAYLSYSIVTGTHNPGLLLLAAFILGIDALQQFLMAFSKK